MLAKKGRVNLQQRHGEPLLADSHAEGAFVEFDRVQKSYDGENLVVKDLNLSLPKGEFLTMLGPSGSGESTGQRLHQVIFNLSDGILHQVIHAGEVERNQPGKDSQQDVKGEVVHGKGLADGKGKNHLFAHQEIGDYDRSDRGEQEGNDGPGGQIEHQYFEGEDQGRNGGLKDTCNGTGSATSHQQENAFIIESEQVPDVGSYGRAGEHNGSLKSHRSTQSHRQRRGQHGAPGIVGFQMSFPFGDGKEDLTDAVAYVLFQQVLYKDHG